MGTSAQNKIRNDRKAAEAKSYQKRTSKAGKAASKPKSSKASNAMIPQSSGFSGGEITGNALREADSRRALAAKDAADSAAYRAAAPYVEKGKTLADLQAYAATPAAQSARITPTAPAVTRKPLTAEDYNTTTHSFDFDKAFDEVAQSSGFESMINPNSAGTAWNADGSLGVPGADNYIPPGTIDNQGRSIARTPVQMANDGDPMGVTADTVERTGGVEGLIKNVDQEAARDKIFKMGMQPDAPGSGALPTATMGSDPGAALPAVVGGGMTLADGIALGGLGLGAAGVIGSVVTGNKQAEAIKDAATEQSIAAGTAQDLQKTMFDQIRTDQQPWRTAGEEALGYGRDAENNIIDRPGGLRTFEADNPAFNFNNDINDPNADKGYAFRLKEGLKALQNSASARGMLQSGGNLKDISQYGQEMASQEYGNAFNRYNATRDAKRAGLQSLAGVGQTATQQVGAAGQNYANQAGNAMMAGGNARAGGMTGAADAQASGMYGAINTANQGLGAWMNYNNQQDAVSKVSNALRGGY